LLIVGLGVAAWLTFRPRRQASHGQ
jgi:hypothetical protein